MLRYKELKQQQEIRLVIRRSVAVFNLHDTCNCFDHYIKKLACFMLKYKKAKAVKKY